MILLTRLEDGATTFHDLGNEIHVIESEISPARFEEHAKIYFKKSLDHFLPDTRGFIVYENGSQTEPLYKDFYYQLLANTGEVVREMRWPHKSALTWESIKPSLTELAKSMYEDAKKLLEQLKN